ncbi:DnaA N-terminal domain-containing protein [Paenibacillus medicaginis]|uniref:DnaA N-terminal domain-containing protein n=1 Tax=Paenibacillus medicaginis TaxID=1470560 RepID=A0ABV5C4A8_9BACL
MPGHNDATELWLQALETVKKTVEPIQFQTWFKETSATFDGEIFVIICPTSFGKEWLCSRYSNVVLSAVELATGNNAIKISFRSLKRPVEAIDKSHVTLVESTPEDVGALLQNINKKLDDLKKDVEIIFHKVSQQELEINRLKHGGYSIRLKE